MCPCPLRNSGRAEVLGAGFAVCVRCPGRSKRRAGLLRCRVVAIVVSIQEASPTMFGAKVVRTCGRYRVGGVLILDC
jgi:hypothetical protein